jgi:hypothetical protein
MLRAGRSGIQFLAGSRDCLLKNVQTGTGASYSLTTEDSFSMGKAAGTVVDRLLPPSALVKNEWKCSSTPFCAFVE